MDYEYFKKIFKYGFIENDFIYICGKGIYCKIPLNRKEVIFENAKIADGTIDKFLSESRTTPKEKIMNVFSDMRNRLWAIDTDLSYKGNYIFETKDIILMFYSEYIEIARTFFDVYCVDDIFEGLNDFRLHFLDCFINENCYSLCIEEENEEEPIQMQILPVLFPDTVLFKEKDFLTESFLKRLQK